MKKLIFLFIFLGSILVVAQESYYNNVNLNLSGLSLKNELITKITTTHTRFLIYDQVWDASMATDVNPVNNSQVLLIYGWENGSDGDVTNDRERGITNNGGNVGQWNREHVYARSLGTPDLGEIGPGSDAHHLRPSDTQRNSSRGNKKFASGSGNSGSVSSSGWYPGDEWKGDVARMMMYMYLRYDNRCLPSNVGIGNNSSTPDDMIDLFLQWNVEDPVSEFEKQRNMYHENTSNTFAQGNRNPFIDNPYLATRIWGGPEAEDTWGIYTSQDTQAPTIPANLVLSDITTSSMTLSWNASTDNIGVSSYEVYVNGNLFTDTSLTTFNAMNLNPNTNYSFTVLAKDIVGNKSAQSVAVNASTLVDTEPPSIPTNVTISNETIASFKITWTASTDNTAVTNYDIYLDNNFNATTDNTTYTVSGLSSGTSYSVTIAANDSSNNQSNPSIPVSATTQSENGSLANDLFISEYVEGSSNNKAIEIVNLTGTDLNLSIYSIRRQGNGGQDGQVWGNSLNLSGTIINNDVYVIINGSATLQTLIDQADFVQINDNTTNFGEPINFNGNDPVGLFKNGELIDIVGFYDGGSANFAMNTTLRRKPSVSSPNILFDQPNEWDSYPQDTVDNIGIHSSTLSNQNLEQTKISIFPNPVYNYVKFHGTHQNSQYYIYNILGKEIQKGKIINNQIEVSQLKKGIYILKLINNKGLINSVKFIK